MKPVNYRTAEKPRVEVVQTGAAYDRGGYRAVVRSARTGGVLVAGPVEQDLQAADACRAMFRHEQKMGR